jgi:hypothetical protein
VSKAAVIGAMNIQRRVPALSLQKQATEAAVFVERLTQAFPSAFLPKNAGVLSRLAI